MTSTTEDTRMTGSAPTADPTPAAPATKSKPAPGERTGDRAKYREERKGDIKLPKKKHYRQRAHANPFSDHALE